MASAASSLASIAGQPAHPHEFYTSGESLEYFEAHFILSVSFAVNQPPFPPDPYAGAAPGSGMVDPWQNYMAAAASGHAAYYSAGAAAAAAGRLNQVFNSTVNPSYVGLRAEESPCCLVHLETLNQLLAVSPSPVHGVSPAAAGSIFDVVIIIGGCSEFVGGSSGSRRRGRVWCRRL